MNTQHSGDDSDCSSEHLLRARNRPNFFKRLAAIVIASFVASTSVQGTAIRLTLRFDRPLVNKDAQGFTHLYLPATVQAGKAGEPSFPFRGVQVLLPPGETLTDVKVQKKGWVSIGEKHRLYPYQHPYPGVIPDEEPNALDGIGDIAEKNHSFIMNGAVYESDDWILPAYKFHTGFMRGHSIAFGAISPVRYRPSTGSIGYYKTLELEFETAPLPEAKGSVSLLRNDEPTNRMIAELVENPSMLAAYDNPNEGAEGADDYRYLIITRDSLVGAFAPLRNFYTRRGIKTKIITIEYIEANYSGIDTAEKTRNAVIDEYTNHGIDYVLLGGDGDGAPSDPKIVPYRGFYCGVQSSSFYEDDNIPADIYFANLDGNWNDDDDSRWGEPGEEDFYSEVAVGRACVDTPDEAAAFVNKTIMYQQNPVLDNTTNATLLGEKLWDDPLTYGGDEMDQLIDTCTAYGFTTVGIPSYFNITKYYDRDLGSWSSSTSIGAINAGTNWLSHAGHSNWSYVLRISSSSINSSTFTNDGVATEFPIIYSYGCYAASFDNRTTDSYTSNDCIAEIMATDNHCAVAFLGNSRYGWFTEGTTNGPSHHLQREFFDAVFSEGITKLGAANQRSKDETVPFIGLPNEYEPGAQRWCYYTLNLLGDPALDGWTGTPQPLTVNHQPSIERTATAAYVDTDASDAVASCYRNGILYGVGYADSLGHITVSFTTPFPDSIDSVELVVTAHNRLEYSDMIDLVDTTGNEDLPPLTVLEQNIPNPFNPSTTIKFTLESKCHAELVVYDASGRTVDRLIDGILNAGSHSVKWRPTGIASGVYFYSLRAGNRTITRKAVLLR